MTVQEVKVTGRERVRRCLEFDHPDRVPRDLALLPASEAFYGRAALQDLERRWPRDFVQCHVGRPGPTREQGDLYAAGRYRDEWGCVFENLRGGYMGQVKEPIVSDGSRLDEVCPPEELLRVDPGAVNAFCRGERRFVFASGWARPFERMQFLRGTENLFYDLGEESAGLVALCDKVHDFFRRQFETWSRTEVDALVIMDDWGSQSSLLISPRQWRRLFKPMYADYGRIARAAGKKLFMHSDGHILEILDDLIEVGVDAINAQLWCMDLAALGQRFGGRITFWGQVDAQHTLPEGSPEDVRQAVREIVGHVARPGGGTIAQFALYPPTPIANAEAAYRAWDEFAPA